VSTNRPSYFVVALVSALACASETPGGADENIEPPALDCVDAEPIPQAGDTPSGFEQCGDGFVHRVAAVTCDQPAPSDTCDASDSACATAADCTARPYGACVTSAEEGGACACTYGCASDADCDDGRICACAGVGGATAPSCIPALCTTSADCTGLCGLSRVSDPCGGAVDMRLACLDETSECRIECPQVEGCYEGVGTPRCEIIQSDWICNENSLCEDCG
jgi:hypothetical protein